MPWTTSYCAISGSRSGQERSREDLSLLGCFSSSTSVWAFKRQTSCTLGIMDHFIWNLFCINVIIGHRGGGDKVGAGEREGACKQEIQISYEKYFIFMTYFMSKPCCYKHTHTAVDTHQSLGFHSSSPAKYCTRKRANKKKIKKKDLPAV